MSEFSSESASPSISAEPDGRPEAIPADAVVIFTSEGVPRQGGLAAADAATGGLLGRLAEAGEITGRACECVPLLGPPGFAAGQLLVVGLGTAEQIDAGSLYRAAATAARQLAGRPRGMVAFVAEESWPAAAVEHAVAGAAAGMVGQDLYRKEKKRTPFAATRWLGLPPSTAERIVEHGRLIGEGVNLTRRLVNLAADDMFPGAFAEEAASVAGRLGIEIEIWDKQRLEQERCGALLAVARGSSRPPRLVLLRYRGGTGSGLRDGNPPDLALVGKGVTFDSGGLSLKPADSMMGMKCDMAGAATMLGTIATIAALKLPLDVVAAMGLVENMTGPAAYKVGDVLTARSGITIEVHNTDAEGRLVLADVLDVVRGFEPGFIVDAATLTGACVVALGLDVAGLFTNDQACCDAVATAAAAAGEAVWQLPMFRDYDAQIESDVADIKNVGDGRWGGATTAAKLLERFVGSTPWTHIDIAGPAFAEKPKPWIDGGGTGAMVRTLIELARATSKLQA
jgi:leucyl aminopeptidase